MTALACIAAVVGLCGAFMALSLGGSLGMAGFAFGGAAYAVLYAMEREKNKALHTALALRGSTAGPGYGLAPPTSLTREEKDALKRGPTISAAMALLKELRSPETGKEDD